MEFKYSRIFFRRRHPLLAKTKFKPNDKVYNTIHAYIKIIKLSKALNKKDSIKSILTQYKLLIGPDSLPTYGQITSDLLRICLSKEIISERYFYKRHGKELLKLAKISKDKETLNIYAYLQASVKGKVDPSIDKLGWTEFRDERFAISYFIGKASKNRSDDTELAQALLDFPNS